MARVRTMPSEQEEYMRDSSLWQRAHMIFCSDAAIGRMQTVSRQVRHTRSEDPVSDHVSGHLAGHLCKVYVSCLSAVFVFVTASGSFADMI